MNKAEHWRSLVVLLWAAIMIAFSGCQGINSDSDADPETGMGSEKAVDIYVAGYIHSAKVYNTVINPCYWKNGERTDLIPLGTADNYQYPDWPRGVSGVAYSIHVDGYDVYVAGEINDKGRWQASLPCYWKNGVRSDLDIGSANEGEARSIFIYNGDVYVCGHTFTWNPMRFAPCYWKNGVRTDLLESGYDGRTSSIVVSAEGVFVSGNVGMVRYGPTAYGYWKNGAWTELFALNLYAASIGELASIAVDGHDVYAAGWTDTPSTQNVPSVWANGVRTVLKVLTPPRSGRANSVFAATGVVYVAGWTKNKRFAAIPCYWKNGARTDLSVLNPNMDNSSANSIQALGRSVYVAGETFRMGLPVPCYWQNGARTDLSVGGRYMEGHGCSIFVTYR